ncbi:MAG: YSC84-related protein [Burkholderiaceae bacterium]
MIRRKLFLSLGAAAFVSACTTTNPDISGSASSKRQKIDAGVTSALSKLVAQVPDSRNLMALARGILVFPSVLSAGFVVGGSYGQGALLEGGRTTGYYSTVAASVGLLAGAESKAVYILFMTQDALDKFKASRGWAVGADASVTMIKAGASASVDTQTARNPVIGYALSNAGLMASLSLDGTKITPLNL